MSRLRAALTMLTSIAGDRDMQKTARKLAAGTARSVRSGSLGQDMSGLAATVHAAQAESSSWLEPGDIETGASGPFDSCDLRVWLVVAERAGVPFVPAVTIMSLHEDELGSVTQKVQLPPGLMAKVVKRLQDRQGEEREAPFEKDMETLEGAFFAPPTGKLRAPGAIIDQSFDAMDRVPEGWMVRSNISGGAVLKTFAGAGVISSASDTGRLDVDIEVGPGWVRNGNRRRIDLADNRIISSFAGGHKDTIHFLARPWMEADRRNTGEDPLRHGTPFAGIGSWPCEWRVFVQNGRVTGVSSYYGWCAETTAHDAAMALEAAAMAQRMVDAASDMCLVPRFMDIELLRGAESKPHPVIAKILEDHPSDGISCTLDFLEVRGRGMMFLEGGPPHTPIGGGHCCSFAGNGTDRAIGLYSRCEGVALRLMDGVSLGDPKTWFDRTSKGCILTWDEARALAGQNMDLEPSP